MKLGFTDFCLEIGIESLEVIVIRESWSVVREGGPPPAARLYMGIGSDGEIHIKGALHELCAHLPAIRNPQSEIRLITGKNDK